MAETPEEIAARLMSFRHTEADPPTDVVVNGEPIVVTEDSTMFELAQQIRKAQAD